MCQNLFFFVITKSSSSWDDHCVFLIYTCKKKNMYKFQLKYEKEFNCEFSNEYNLQKKQSTTATTASTTTYCFRSVFFLFKNVLL